MILVRWPHVVQAYQKCCPLVQVIHTTRYRILLFGVPHVVLSEVLPPGPGIHTTKYQVQNASNMLLLKIMIFMQLKGPEI